MARKRAEDETQVKEVQVKRSRLCRNKKKLDDPVKAKMEQNEGQQKHRKVNNRSDRLKEFREATKYAAIFICTCCQQRMFGATTQPILPQPILPQPILPQPILPQPIIATTYTCHNLYLP